jgi:hypothetical protein
LIEIDLFEAIEIGLASSSAVRRGRAAMFQCPRPRSAVPNCCEKRRPERSRAASVGWVIAGAPGRTAATGAGSVVVCRIVPERISGGVVSITSCPGDTCCPGGTSGGAGWAVPAKVTVHTIRESSATRPTRMIDRQNHG